MLSQQTRGNKQKATVAKSQKKKGKEQTKRCSYALDIWLRRRAMAWNGAPALKISPSEKKKNEEREGIGGTEIQIRRDFVSIKSQILQLVNILTFCSLEVLGKG